jgi:hypothetical protein
LTKSQKRKSFRAARDRKSVKFPTFERPIPVLWFKGGVPAERRIQPKQSPLDIPRRAGFLLGALF